jgi:hypothetical protein
MIKGIVNLEMKKLLFLESRNLKNKNLGLKDKKFKLCFQHSASPPSLGLGN